MSIEGFGAKFEYADAGTDVDAASGFTAVGNVTDLKLPEPEVADIKTTTHDNATKVHTYQAGICEPGNSEVTVHYDKTVFATLKGLRGTNKVFRVRFSDGSGIGWGGYIKGDPAPSVDLEGLTTMTVKTKVSGDTEGFAAVGGS